VVDKHYRNSDMVVVVVDYTEDSRHNHLENLEHRSFDMAVAVDCMAVVVADCMVAVDCMVVVEDNHLAVIDMDFGYQYYLVVVDKDLLVDKDFDCQDYLVVIDKDLMKNMDFGNLIGMVVVVVDYLDIQKMDFDLDKDLIVEDKDFVDNRYLLAVMVEVAVPCSEENKMNNYLYLVVDYLLNKDCYTVLMMEDLMDMVFEMIVLLDTVCLDWMVAPLN
jgi:hypothetical protein